MTILNKQLELNAQRAVAETECGGLALVSKRQSELLINESEEVKETVTRLLEVASR